MLVLAIIKGDANDDTLYLQLECRRRFTRRPPVNFYTTYEAIKAKWLFLHKLFINNHTITDLETKTVKSPVRSCRLLLKTTPRWKCFGLLVFHGHTAIYSQTVIKLDLFF